MRTNIEQDEVNERKKGTPLLESLSILIAWRRFIIINYLVVFIIVVIIVFLLPKWYRATASILPPKDQTLQNILGGSSSILRGLSAARLGGFGQSPGTYNFLAILNSRSTMEEVVNKFNLNEVYGFPQNLTEETIKQLRDNSSFETQDNENIDIQVLDKDPIRAAAMANYFVEILNRRSLELGTAEAKSNREFIGHRVDEVKDSLGIAEDRLKEYQEKSGMIMTPEETGGIKAIADLYAMKAKKEIETAILVKTVSPENDALKQDRIELAEITEKLSGIPQAGLTSVRLYRDAITYEKMLEVLLPMFEQAKINEQKDIPTLLVLDKAIPAERKIKPQRLLIILSVSTIWLMFMVALIYLFQGIHLRKKDMNVNTRKLSNAIQWIIKAYRINIDV